MQITCKQQDLSHALSLVGHAVSGRAALPILANILFTAEAGRLTLATTNLEIGIRCWIDVEVVEEGRTTIPAKLISDLVNSLQGEVELETDEKHVTSVRSQRSRATLKGMEPSEFPFLLFAEAGEPPVDLEVKQLKATIEQVIFATADDDSRPILTAIVVEVGNEKLTFAGADAFRMARRSDAFPGGEDNSPLLIPARTLKELVRILPSEGNVQMVATPNRGQVLFHTDQIDLVSRLIEGTFPNFRSIIPKEYTTRIVVDTKEFAAAIKSVAPFARDSSNITILKASGDTLTIEATAEDVGSNVSTVAAVIDGPQQEIIFNVKYLSDILSATDTTEIALELISKARPGVLKPVNGPDVVYVIMPMGTNR